MENNLKLEQSRAYRDYYAHHFAIPLIQFYWSEDAKMPGNFNNIAKQIAKLSYILTDAMIKESGN